MADLIDRQAAIDALARVARKKFTLSDEFNHYLAGLMDGENAIRQLPSVQPEIIRCMDCKHRDKYGCCKYWEGWGMGYIPIATDDYDFCSYAKRI